MHEYKIGDIVKINLPAGWLEGKIVAGPSIKWSHCGEVKYEVHGMSKKTPFVSIVSARSIKQ